MFGSYKLGASKIVYGVNAIDYLKELSGKRAFIVTNGDTLRKLGFEASIIKNLESAGFETMVFDDVESDPSFESIYAGAAKMREFQPDWVIGLGGGSAMDAAKVMWVLYENEELQTIESVSGSDKINKLREKAHICCIATTSGTGSEVTRAAVITDTVNDIKYAVGDKQLRLVPDVAILDPELTKSMPSSLTAATGMDAITHAVETYISCKANPFSDILSKGSFELAFKNIRVAVNEPNNTEARGNMLAASAIAGISFSNGGLGVCHSISHAVGGLFHVPHGLANAIILPHVLDFYSNKNEDIKDKCTELANTVEEQDLVKTIHKLNEDIGIPKSFIEVVKDFDKERDIQRLAEVSLADSNTGNSPIIPTEHEIIAIINKVFE